MKSISVVTASYNASIFIRECLESVYSQIREEMRIEHIVVDGESKDETIELLKTWEKDIQKEANPAYVFRWISEPDSGQSSAFNKGINLAKGDWICWLNADDLLAPDAFTAFLNTVDKHPKSQLIYGHISFISEQGVPIRTSYHLPFFYPLTLYGCYAPPSVGTFFKHDLLLEEPLDEEYHYVMDTEWYLRCGMRLKTALVDQTFAYFRISTKAKTSEMVRSGMVTERHATERENYRRKHVYTKWPQLSDAQIKRRFERRHKFFMIFYYILKSRYAFRYIMQRVTACKRLLIGM